MVKLGSDSVREVPDYHLSRFACYLIAQNGGPRKPEIAQAQKYFAIQSGMLAWLCIESSTFLFTFHAFEGSHALSLA